MHAAEEECGWLMVAQDWLEGEDGMGWDGMSSLRGFSIIETESRPHLLQQPA